MHAVAVKTRRPAAIAHDPETGNLIPGIGCAGKLRRARAGAGNGPERGREEGDGGAKRAGRLSLHSLPGGMIKFAGLGACPLNVRFVQ